VPRLGRFHISNLGMLGAPLIMKKLTKEEISYLVVIAAFVVLLFLLIQ
jgi:hypothetical protein